MHLHNHINELYAIQLIERDSWSFILKKCVTKMLCMQDMLHSSPKSMVSGKANIKEGFHETSNKFVPFSYKQARYSF